MEEVTLSDDFFLNNVDVSVRMSSYLRNNVAGDSSEIDQLSSGKYWVSSFKWKIIYHVPFISGSVKIMYTLHRIS